MRAVTDNRDRKAKKEERMVQLGIKLVRRISRRKRKKYKAEVLYIYIYIYSEHNQAQRSTSQTIGKKKPPHDQLPKVSTLDVSKGGSRKAIRSMSIGAIAWQTPSTGLLLR